MAGVSCRTRARSGSALRLLDAPYPGRRYLRCHFTDGDRSRVTLTSAAQRLAKSFTAACRSGGHTKPLGSFLRRAVSCRRLRRAPEPLSKQTSLPRRVAAPTYPHDGESDPHVLTRNCYSFLDRSQVIVRTSDNRAKVTPCVVSNATQREYAGCGPYSTSILTRC
jgi:hypothetical protein